MLSFKRVPTKPHPPLRGDLPRGEVTFCWNPISHKFGEEPRGRVALLVATKFDEEPPEEE